MFCTGIVTAIACNCAMQLFRKFAGIDDTLDVFPGHGVGGTVGT